MVAASLVHRRCSLSHFSAGWLLHMPTLGPWPVMPWLTTSNPAKTKAMGSTNRVRIRVAALPEHHVWRRSLWSLTSPARTVLDLSREAGLRQGVVAADAMIARGCCGLPELHEALIGCDGWPGIEAARAAVRLADPRSESPYESLARLQLHQAKVRAEPQVWAYDENGAIGRGDLWLPDRWTFVEVDGAVKYRADQPADTLLAEKLRQERFERAGFGVVRVSPGEIGRSPTHLLRRVEQVAQRVAAVHAVGVGPAGWIGPPPRWAVRAGAPAKRPCHAFGVT